MIIAVAKYASKWSAKLAPFIVAIICFLYVPSTLWTEVTGVVVTMLSLLTAAILLRVMRPFPITDPDGFADRDEIGLLEAAIIHAMRILSFAAVISVVTILLLVFKPVFHDLRVGIALVDEYRGEFYSAAIGWMIIFAAVRIAYAVRLDFSIVRKQAQAVTQSYKRKRARESEEARKAQDDRDLVLQDKGAYPGRSREAKH